MVATGALRAHNYLALWRMRRVYPRLSRERGRYFLARGDYPYACALRTPQGVVAPTLSHRRHVDRQRGLLPSRLRGRSLGPDRRRRRIEHRDQRAVLPHPQPKLPGLAVRACAAQRGASRVQPGGLRGSLRRCARPPSHRRPGGELRRRGVRTLRRTRPWSPDSTIEVPARPVDDVLEHVLAHGPAVDVLKVDTEGTELEIVSAIRPDLLRRVRTAYLEVAGARRTARRSV